jgi:Fe2+ transport system protein FeoA
MATVAANDPVRTLGALSKGERGIVRGLNGGHVFRRRAANLGFTAGVEVTVVQNYGHGPIIVALRGTRVALGRDEAGQVLIEE